VPKSGVLGALLVTARPRRWIKNLLVFAGLIFSRGLHDPALVARSVAAFVPFCLLSAGIYLINDAERDRHHPQKRHRPVASGQLSAGLALSVGIALLVGASLAAFGLSSDSRRWPSPMPPY
jgi:decaprenyl-phosphate phosphoribosyltransferase